MTKLIFSCFVVIIGLICLSCFLLLGNDSTIGNADDLSKVVLLGSIDITDNKLESISLWDRGETAKDVKFAEIEASTIIDVDVLNCAGYIASAKAKYNSHSTYWKLEIIPETVAIDAVEKVNRCLEYPNLKYISSSAFAVSPTDEKRKQIKLNKLEKPSIYSLPISIQMWAIKDGIGNWADTDGDGKADLVTVSGKCGTSEESICTKTLSWTGLRWFEIAYSSPA